MYAVDFANYAGRFDQSFGPILRDSNRRVVIGTQDAAIATHQAVICQESCLEVQLYQFNYFSVPIEREAAKTSAVAGVLSKPFVWLDFEDTLPEMVRRELHVDVIKAWMHKITMRTIGEFGVERVGIYTRESWWREYTGNTNEFSYLPLWNALYDDTPDLNVWDKYGGWQAQTMKQYAKDFGLFGIKVDLNVY